MSNQKYSTSFPSVSPLKSYSSEEEYKNGKMESEDKQNKTKRTWKSLIYNFAASSTAHGIGRIAAGDTLLKRGTWSVICLAVYAALFWFCSVLIVQYMNKPVITKVEMAFEESVDFPSITICNLNMLKRRHLSRIAKIKSFMDRFNDTPRKPQSKRDISSYNVTREMEKKKEIMAARAKTKSQRKFFSGVEVDTEGLQKQFFSKIIKGIPTKELSSYGHKLGEMVVRCRWSRYRCDRGNLRKLWKHFWHWRFGSCYTFNSGRSESGEKQEVLTTDDPGPNNGMQLDLFVDQNEYTSNTEEAGIRVVISDQGIMPFPDEQGFSVPTGFSTTVGIRRMRLKRVDPFQNQSCYVDADDVATKQVVNTTSSANAENIYKHKYHVRYSVQACRKSCLAQLQQQICNCTEAKFPVNSSDCSTTAQGICITGVSQKYLKKGGLCAEQCPLPCKDDTFRYRVSSSQWSALYQIKMKRKHRGPKGSVSLGENFLRLNIFYEDFSVEKVIYEEGYTIDNLLADIGGQLGLWIGVSVLTVTEVLELISSLLYMGIKKIYKARKNE